MSLLTSYLLNITIISVTANNPAQKKGVKSGTKSNILKKIENNAIPKLENIKLSFGLLLNNMNDIYDMKKITINNMLPN